MEQYVHMLVHMLKICVEYDRLQAAVLVGQSAHWGKELLEENLVGPAIVHPAETATQGPLWSNLAELGVQRALIVGIGLQVLQQVRKNTACTLS